MDQISKRETDAVGFRGVRFDDPRELKGHQVVGVDRQDPFGVDVFQPGVALSRKGIERALDHFNVGEPGADLQGRVRASAIHDKDPVRPLQPFEATSDVGFLVPGENERSDGSKVHAEQGA